MESLGNHKNTQLTYDEFANGGRFIQAFDTRVDRNPVPGEVPPKQPQKVSIRFQAKFHVAVKTPTVLLVLFLNHYVYSISRGGRVEHT